MPSPTLVLLEHHEGRVPPPSLTAITLARQLGAPYDLLLIGYRLDAAVDSVRGLGARTVLVLDDESLRDEVADRYAQAICSQLKSTEPRYLVAASSTFAKDVLSRIAGLVDADMITDVAEVVAEDGRVRFRRPVYAGNAVATVEAESVPCVLTARPTAFDAPAPAEKQSPVESVSVDVSQLPSESSLIDREKRISSRPELTEARVVVSGGRPLRDEATFQQLIGGLADALGGAIGATRAAVDSGIAPNDWQVGQTGKAVAPELYIAVGISGAIQHLAGMKDSKVIVAINKDPEAPIFQVATYGLVGDLFQIVPELTDKLKRVSG